MPHLRIQMAGFETSRCGIQWMRFDADAPYPEVVKTIPHVAFEVDDLAHVATWAANSDSASQSECGGQSCHKWRPIELMEFSEAQDYWEPK